MKLPVAIIGGGPVGLAAAAQLQARGESFILLESGSQIGASILEWGHVRMFSPWEYNMDKTAVSLLAKYDWNAPQLEAIPTGKELVEMYLQPLAALPEISPYIRVNSKVVSVGRKNIDKMKTKGRDQLPFVIRYEQNGEMNTVEARAIIDASGTWKHPNPIGSGGIFAKGEESASQRITYGIPDVYGNQRQRYAGKRVLVVGSGHSAINTILDLHRLKEEVPSTDIVWVLRKISVQETYGGGNEDQLPARGALGTAIQHLVEGGLLTVYTPFQIEEISNEGNALLVAGTLAGQPFNIGGIDEIIANTGSRPDLDFLREIRYQVDPSIECVPALADLIDPNIHSCGTVRPHGEAELRQPEKDFYIVGMKSYGRAPTFLLATGYEQVRSVVAALVGDWEAARRVELHLPETGVCSSNPLTVGFEAVSSCCAPLPQVPRNCCG
ncbi:NAD(P)-binding domain-containing protein [Brevibacillus composti]|uniref:NAD(P)-binding domain-containing protein n=1 Tax=Brevibacillus composti TaxID=2796470 RepID=A0A7T5JNK0_9BACL|nr:NAD(P)-binding domain-containing protein [Brevibacillus composti]QQE74162.1 NAD(P)-binding domain-containing protein [Brevibacillus composti]QUO41245.1 NAD(P)-binding domain-containing protein [Brevibacillus composti]